MIKVTAVGLKKLSRGINYESKRQKRALDTAVKVEGFRLMKLLKQEIRDASPGGQRFAPLRRITWGSNRKTRTPLRRLAVAVRYFIADRDPLEMHIGWTGPRVSASWKRIAKKQQEGFTETLTDSKRASFIHWGARMGKSNPRRKYHFLKSSTKSMKTPARPIIEPFWRAHRNHAMRNIASNFRKKLRGQRI